MNFKKVLLSTVAGLSLAGTTMFLQPVSADANTEWVARTAAEVKADIEQVGENDQYTIQWGDTLSAISEATGISVDKLVAINDVKNANLIYVGTKLTFNGDYTQVTVENEEDTTTYDVETTEEVATQPAAPAPVEQAPAETAPATQGRWLTVEATAYSYNEPGLTYFTANGTDLRQNPQVIAVDPSVIPLGSRVYIPGYGTYIAADTGGAIVGNRIDVHIIDLNAVTQFGRRTLDIQILD